MYVHIINLVLCLFGWVQVPEAQTGNTQRMSVCVCVCVRVCVKVYVYENERQKECVSQKQTVWYYCVPETV